MLPFPHATDRLPPGPVTDAIYLRNRCIVFYTRADAIDTPPLAKHGLHNACAAVHGQPCRLAKYQVPICQDLWA
jgi:hypothetical protein